VPGLGLEKRGIHAGILDERFVRPGLRDLSVDQHENPIRTPNRRQAVTDEDGGAVPGELMDVIEDLGLGARVECGGKLVQYDERRGSQEGAGQRQVLPRTDAEVDAVLELPAPRPSSRWIVYRLAMA
jgi:hypothetical protein